MPTLTLNNQDAYAIARFLALMPPGDMSNAPLAQLLLTNLDPQNEKHRNSIMVMLSQHLGQVLKHDPSGPPPALETTNEAYVPPLPARAQLSDSALKAAENVGGWYQQAVKWAAQRSPMTPVHFLEAGVTWLIGLAVARRVCLSLHEDIFPHLYVLLVAETSKYAKSTGLNALYSMVMGAMPHMLIPGNTSPEGMVEILTGQLPTNFDKLSKKDQIWIEAGRQFAGQRGIVLDEYSSLLGAGKKDYMQGFIELLMRLYDARESEAHYTRSGGMMLIRFPGISILGATTPAAMARACTYEVWENGANARYLMMFRENPLPYTPNYIDATPPVDLLKPLMTLHNALPKMRDELNKDMDFTAHHASLTPGAFAMYQAYTQAVYYDMLTEDLDERLHGNYRRMHIQMLKAALAIACMDWAAAGAAGRVEVNEGHIALGQQLSEKSRASLHRLMPVLSQSTDMRTHRDLIGILKREPYMTVRDIVRKIGRNTKDIRSALEVLIESGEIEKLDHHPVTGRPSQLYRLVSGN